MEEMIKYVCTLVIIEYYGIILMNGGVGGQCSWVAKTVLVLGYIILLVASLR